MKVNNQEQNVVMFKNIVLETFKANRIVALLFYGTRAFGINNDDGSDYDFILVLDKYDAMDVIKCHKLVNRNEFEFLNLCFNFIYLVDIISRGAKNFQLRSVSLSLTEHLTRAKVLIGENIFNYNPQKLSLKEIESEFKFKIQEYYGRCDKLFVQKISEQDLYVTLVKYTRDIVRYFLIMKENMTIDDMSKYSYKDMVDIAIKENVFSMDVLKKLPILLKQYSGRDSILKVDNVRRSIYEQFLKTYY